MSKELINTVGDISIFKIKTNIKGTVTVIYEITNPVKQWHIGPHTAEDTIKELCILLDKRKVK